MLGRLLLLPFLFIVIQSEVALSQVGLIVQGGIHSSRLDRPERIYAAGGSFDLQGAEGEASTLGLRGERWLSARIGIDAGVAWSRNRSWQGSTSIFPPPSFITHLVFTSATLRLRLTRPAAPLGLMVGVGPSVIFHGGTGTSQLQRQTDLGGVLMAGVQIRVSPRLGVRLDAQEYLFSSRFAESYRPPLLDNPVQPAGSRFRQELVLLMGLSYRFR
jgi:hypothetical protein